VASRIVSLFNRRQKLEPQRQALMTRELQRILAKDGLSKDVYEIVSKNLAA
jgi:aminopeptidase N